MVSALWTRAGSGRRRPGRPLRPVLAAGIGIWLISCTPTASVDKESAHVPAATPAGAGGRVYVTNQQDNTLSVIDARTYKVVATVPAGVAPEGVAVTKDGRHVYIANSGSARVSVLDVAATSVDALVVISYNDPNPAAYAKKLLKEFPQWPAAKNNRYTVLSDSIYLGPSNDLAVDKIARMLHPDAL